jgi:NAD(P)-dependent dehydrogenase (short-subunit alcohol dehydrogenase family)
MQSFPASTTPTWPHRFELRDSAPSQDVVEQERFAMADPDDMAVPQYTSQHSLEGRIFVVIGAGQGIGRQAAHAVSQAGARVICVGRGREATERVASEVGGEAILADVTKRNDAARLFRDIEEAHGALHGVIDIVAMGLPPTSLADMTDEAWDVQFDNVLRHALYDVQIGAALMAKSGGGSITLVGSVAGDLVTIAQPAYAIAKAGLHHMIRVAASELGAQNVRVNGVVPGLTLTPRVKASLGDARLARVASHYPLKRLPDATDIASAILFLASPMSRNVTGQTLTVDGGASIRASDPISPKGVPA